jgi:hypothetical protein
MTNAVRWDVAHERTFRENAGALGRAEILASAVWFGAAVACGMTARMTEGMTGVTSQAAIGTRCCMQVALGPRMALGQLLRHDLVVGEARGDMLGQAHTSVPEVGRSR